MTTYSLRIKDREYEKIKIIAEKQGRSINKQIEQIIYQYISDYERVNGEIKIPEFP